MCIQSYCFMSRAKDFKNLSLCKYLLWYIFSRTNPFADVSDKPIRDIELDLDAFSQAKPISIPACRSKPLIPAIIIHHHSPGPGTALSISCPLIPDTGSLQQPGCNPVHPPGISYHTRGRCYTATQTAKTPQRPSVGRHTQSHLKRSVFEKWKSLNDWPGSFSLGSVRLINFTCFKAASIRNKLLPNNTWVQM